jgi:predicted DNA-binding transcriptional regulator YafY
MKSEDPVMFAQAVTAAILCRSWKNPITGAALAQSFSVDIRRITGVIEEARDAGIKIASSKGGFDKHINRQLEPGYYQAKTPEEMRSTYDMYQATIKNLSARAKKIMNFNGVNPSLYEQDAA